VGFRVQGSGLRVEGSPSSSLSLSSSSSASFAAPSSPLSPLWIEGLRDQGSGFRVQGSGFKVQGSGSRVQDSGFRVQSSRLRIQSSGFRAQGLSLLGGGLLRAWDLRCRVSRLGFWVWGSPPPYHPSPPPPHRSHSPHPHHPRPHPFALHVFWRLWKQQHAFGRHFLGESPQHLRPTPPPEGVQGPGFEFFGLVSVHGVGLTVPGFGFGV